MSNTDQSTNAGKPTTRRTARQRGDILLSHEIITYPSRKQREKTGKRVMSAPNSPATETELGEQDGRKESTMADASKEKSLTNLPTTKTTDNSQPATITIKGYPTDAPSITPPWIEKTSMESRQLHSSQKEAMKKIPEFSGEENELDIDEWLFDLTNLFQLMKLNDETKILETMGKLTGPALRWYQQHLHTFTTWKQTEQALQERFREHILDSQLMKEFFQLHQEEHQSIISFYEMVIRKHRKASQFITERQLITVLQNGVKNALKEHLIRKEKEIHSPERWLELAREEEYIQKRVQQRLEETTHDAFQTRLPIATINTQPVKPQHQQEQHRRQTQSINSQLQRQHNQTGPSAKLCLICNRGNHVARQCFYRKESGCFKCGQPNHRIRDCPQNHFFE